MQKTALAITMTTLLATAAQAQQTMVETYHQDGAEVRVVLHPFLTDEETMTLRLVGQTPEALALFVSEGPGFSAMAVAPEEGLVRDGAPVASAIALSGVESADTARQAATEACDAARSTNTPCAVVLEVAPR